MGGQIIISSLTRKAAKAAMLPLGLLSQQHRRTLVILCYHKVGAGDREIDLRASVFARHMAFLAQTGLARSLGAAMRSDSGGGIVVSVDDGYADFTANVLPVIVQNRIPAILYSATGLIADGNPPVDRDALTWSQLREATSTGLVTVGSHTHSHANLAHATEQEAEVEMRRSKDLIEERLGVECQHFAYPWGVASPLAERAARRLFETAALGWETNQLDSLDPYRLGRTPILRSDGQRFFRAKVKGRLDGEATIYRLLRRGPWRRM